MRIDEVENSNTPDPTKLMGLVNFLAGRANDENAQKQISTDAFISAARSLGFPVNEKNIVSVVSQPPLDSVLEPMDSQNNQIQRCGPRRTNPNACEQGTRHCGRIGQISCCQRPRLVTNLIDRH